MRTRRHHNNEGKSQVQNGKTHRQIRCIARRMGIPYGILGHKFPKDEGGCDGWEEQQDHWQVSEPENA